METERNQRYLSRILREKQANRQNPFNSPPSSTGSHGTVSPTMTSVFSDPDGESTRRLNNDIARITGGKKLPVNWEAAHRKWPEYFSKPQNSLFDNDAMPLKENHKPAPVKFLQEDSTRDIWNGSRRKRADMQPRADDESDLSILLSKSPAAALSLKNNRHLSPISRAHARAPSEPAPLLQRRPSISEALERLRKASSSPKQTDQKQMPETNGPSPNASSAKSSFTAVPPSPNSIASPNNDANARSFFMPDVSHLGDFVTGTLRFSGSMKNGVPIFVKQGKVHDKQTSPAAAAHAAVDSVKVPQEEERIFVSMDMIRDEIMFLQEHHEKVQEYAMNLQQQVERLEAQAKAKGQNPDSHRHNDHTAEMNSRLRSEVATLQARLDQATHKLSTSEINSDSISHEKERVLTRLQEACDDINKLTRKLTVKEKALETSQKQLDSSEHVRQDNKALRRDLVAITHSRDALELENSSLRDDNDRLESELQSLRSEIETRRAESDRLRQQRQSLIAENKSLRASKTQLEQNEVLNEDLDEVQHELDVAREELEVLRKENEELEALRRQNEELEALRRQNEELEALRKENEELVSLREDNRSLVRHNEKYFNDNKMIRRENSGFQRSIHDLHEENLKLKEEVDFLKQQMDHYRPAPKANIETDNTTAGLFMPETATDTNISGPDGPTQTKELPDPLEMTGQSQNLTDADYAEVIDMDQIVNASQKKGQTATEQAQKVAFSIPTKPEVLKRTANQGSKRSASRQPPKAHAENHNNYIPRALRYRVQAQPLTSFLDIGKFDSRGSGGVHLFGSIKTPDLGTSYAA
ncbi:rhoptry protein [Beauveria bassiana ARSEF 2860]|uniref:Rhoptry protein n=1 Tax=Beauveria bassiana (strain ARSEF 2860) TaxID=655819 RepID=J4KNJ7_BEAB2|nr:rhoptry protein [Beauveria bassiana ARSEF 2860]EJP65824.1 rhoptry protein [Beauveria bassiana ARSEF 2860]